VKRAIIKISLLILYLAALSFAQKGSVSGLVMDEFGAVIPDAKVQFANENGKAYTASTNGTGEYRIELEKGLYKIIASRPPFTSTVFTNYWVPSNNLLRLDIVLRCIDCETTDCPLADLPLVDTPALIIATEIENRPLEQLLTAPTPKEKTRKTRKKITNEQLNIWNHKARRGSGGEAGTDPFEDLGSGF